MLLPSFCLFFSGCGADLVEEGLVGGSLLDLRVALQLLLCQCELFCYFSLILVSYFTLFCFWVFLFSLFSVAVSLF